MKIRPIFVAVQYVPGLVNFRIIPCVFRTDFMVGVSWLGIEILLMRTSMIKAVLSGEKVYANSKVWGGWM